MTKIFARNSNPRAEEKTVCRAYQIPRKEFLKKRLVDFTVEPESASARFDKVRAGEEIGEFETTHKRADGTEVHFLVNTKRIEYHGRRAVLSINRDITQRKAIEVEQRRLQSERDQLLEQLQLQGSIWLYSEVNHGTTFKIYLPRIDEQAVADDAEQLVQDNRGNETILLVEDEQMVRELATSILREYGYTVLTAASGLEGLRICEHSPQAIDVLVTDVVMPEMSGRQLAETAAQLRPAMKVIYMSGYTDDSVVRHGVLEGDATFVQEPFLPDALASSVRDVLTH